MGGVVVKIKISIPLPKDKEIETTTKIIEALKNNGFDIYNSELVTSHPLLTNPRGYAIGKATVIMMGIYIVNEIINYRYNWDRPPENVQFIPHYYMALHIYTYLDNIQDVLRTIAKIVSEIVNSKINIDELKIGDSSIDKLNLY
jgi:hypothetical protein